MIPTSLGHFPRLLLFYVLFTYNKRFKAVQATTALGYEVFCCPNCAAPLNRGLFCLPYQEYSHPNGFSLNSSVVLVEMPSDMQIHFYGTLVGQR